jgi:hypothetical protein
MVMTMKKTITSRGGNEMIQIEALKEENKGDEVLYQDKNGGRGFGTIMGWDDRMVFVRYYAVLESDPVDPKYLTFTSGQEREVVYA